jgi:hypothetical protein
VAALLCTCVVTGVGLSALTPLRLSFEERVAYGAVVGAMAVVLSGIVVTRLFDFSGASVTVAVLVALAVGLVGVVRSRRVLHADIANLVARSRLSPMHPESPAPLFVLVVPAWVVTVRILDGAYPAAADGGIDAGHLATFSDWQAHLAYAGSFAYGGSLDLELPIASGNDLAYHFGINFLAAMIVSAGSSLTAGLQISSGYLAFAFPAVMYLVGVRIFERRAVAFWATVIFVLFGGWGWSRFLDDVGERGWSVIWDLPRTYTRDPGEGWWIENPVVGVLYPQRPTLFGLSIALIATALLWTGYRHGGRGPFLTAGVIVGAAPLFHLFGYGTALVLGILWAVMDRRRVWLWFVVPAVVLSIPAVAFLLPPSSSADWFYDWVGHVSDDNWVWFWLKNLGLFLPLVLVGQLWKGTLTKTHAIAFVPVWLWFIVPNFVKPHPWEGNNTHYFVFFLVLGVFPVAATLVRLTDVFPSSTAVVAVVVVTMTAAGALDIFAAADRTTGRYPLMSGSDVLVAEWVRENTDPEAVLVVAPSNTHSIPALSGRTVQMSFSGWVFDLGIEDWAERSGDAGTILARGAGADDLIEEYGVDYVVIGPRERVDFGADPAVWDAVAPVAYDFGGYRIYAASESAVATVSAVEGGS